VLVPSVITISAVPWHVTPFGVHDGTTVAI
jgi:hypothetical protein